MEGYLTTTEAATRLGISTARIRRMILDELIKGVEKFGRENVIPEAEIERLEKIDRKAGRPAKAKEDSTSEIRK